MSADAAPKGARYLVLDANIFLHCRPFHELDWRELADGRDVMLVLTTQVQRELDKQKSQHPRRSVQDRARAAVRRLWELVTSDDPRPTVRPGVRLLALSNAPPAGLFERHALDRGMGDHYIVAEVLAFRAASPDADVLLVARDLGILLAARARGIAATEPPPAFELPPEEDPRDKELNALRRERTSRPMLELNFADGSNRHHGTVRRLEGLDEARLKREVAAAMEATADHDAVISGRFGLLPADWVEWYTRRREAYRVDYRRYLERLWLWHSERLNAIRLPGLTLASTGGTPAKDIRAELRFPAGLRPQEEHELSGPPRPPVPPRRPGSLGFGWNTVAKDEPYDDAFGPSERERQRRRDREFFGTSLNLTLAGALRLAIEQRDDTYVVSYTLAKLQQAQSLVLAPLVVGFVREDPASFTLPYTLTADDLSPIEREFHIVVEVVEPCEAFAYPTLPGDA